LRSCFAWLLSILGLQVLCRTTNNCPRWNIWRCYTLKWNLKKTRGCPLPFTCLYVVVWNLACRPSQWTHKKRTSIG
jgi:hypothetical protein